MCRQVTDCDSILYGLAQVDRKSHRLWGEERYDRLSSGGRAVALLEIKGDLRRPEILKGP